MPAAPFVGAVTTRPPAAFSSFTASAHRFTQSSAIKGSLGPAAWGADWATVEPDLFSTWFTFDGANAYETNYAFVYDVDDCFVIDADEPAASPEVMERRLIGGVLSDTYYVFGL